LNEVSSDSAPLTLTELSTLSARMRRLPGDINAFLAASCVPTADGIKTVIWNNELTN